MKKNTTNLKNTDSETEKGLKHLKLVGIGRDYIKERLAVMQTKKKTPNLLQYNQMVEK